MGDTIKWDGREQWSLVFTKEVARTARWVDARLSKIGIRLEKPG